MSRPRLEPDDLGWIAPRLNLTARTFVTCVLTLAAALPAAAQTSAEQGRSITSTPGVLPERARAAAINHILQDRLENLLPRLMRDEGIEMWVIINREYNEDPVYLTLVPEPVFAARRTTMLVIHDRSPREALDRLTVSRYPLQGVYAPAWEGGSDDEQWRRLAEIVRERSPKTIGINVSPGWAFGDGLSASHRDRLLRELGPEWNRRLVSAERLAVRWLETRVGREIEIYPTVVALARSVISEAFSSKVITPGITTTDDVAWYIRQRYTDLGLPVWFMPYVNIQRRGVSDEPNAPFFGRGGVIERGDVLHTDVGISYLRLATDTQEMGYVLRLGEDDVPAGLKEALETGNRWQDLLTDEFVAGRPGNDILARTLARMDDEGIRGSVYTHPIGFFGHGPGPTIGMWDNQGETPVRGDWQLYANTAHAIEGNVKVPIPEWDGQLVQIKLEQTALFDGERVWYLAGRQTSWHLVE